MDPYPFFSRLEGARYLVEWATMHGRKVETLNVESPASGRQSDHNVETPEGWSCEVTRTIDLGTLRDLPRPLYLYHGQPDANHSWSKKEFTPRIPRTSKLQSNEGCRSRGYIDTPWPLDRRAWKATSLEWCGMLMSPGVTWTHVWHATCHLDSCI